MKFTMSSCIIQCLFLVAAIYKGLAEDHWLGIRSAQVHTYAACYGIYHSNYLKPNCSGSEVMAIKTVNSLAKPISSNCPQIIENSNYDEACCIFDPQDCGVRHIQNFYNHYTFCTGQVSCELQSAWDITVCDTTQYLDKTNYMQVQYYCIPRIQVTDICSSDVITGQAVYLWSPGYPSNALKKSSSSNCKCSVEVSCDTHVNISALDIRLESMSGFCRQTLKISDMQDSESITCKENNMFIIGSVYKSSSYFLTIELINQLDRTDGYFWVEVSGGSASSTVTLSCGNSFSASPQNNVEDLEVCPGDPLDTTTLEQSQVSDPTTQSQSSDPTTQSQSSDSTTQSQSSDPTPYPPGPNSAASVKEESGVEGWIIAVVIICLLFLIILIILLCWDRCKNNKQKKIVPNDTTNLISENDFPGYLLNKSGTETSLPPSKFEIPPLGAPISLHEIRSNEASFLPPLPIGQSPSFMTAARKKQLRRYQSNVESVQPDSEDTVTARHQRQRLRRHKTHGQLNPSDIGMHLEGSSSNAGQPIRKPLHDSSIWNVTGYGLSMGEKEDAGSSEFPPPKPIPLTKRFTALEISTPDNLTGGSDESDTNHDFAQDRFSTGSTSILPSDKKNHHWNRLKALYAFSKPK